jgi:hypothetical protein
VVGDLGGGGFVHAFQDVAVRLERERDRSVSEPFADDLRMDACPERGRGGAYLLSILRSACSSVVSGTEAGEAR